MLRQEGVLQFRGGMRVNEDSNNHKGSAGPDCTHYDIQGSYEFQVLVRRKVFFSSPTRLLKGGGVEPFPPGHCLNSGRGAKFHITLVPK